MLVAKLGKGSVMPSLSLRAIAKELGISPAYLSYMVNGKRPWKPGLQVRYLELVNTPDQFVNTRRAQIDTIFGERLPTWQGLPHDSVNDNRRYAREGGSSPPSSLSKN